MQPELVTQCWLLRHELSITSRISCVRCVSACLKEFWTRLTEQFHAPKWKLQVHLWLSACEPPAEPTPFSFESQVVLSNGELLCDSKLHQICPAYRALGA